MNLKKQLRKLDKTSRRLLLAFLLLFLSLFIFSIPVSHVATADYEKAVQEAMLHHEEASISLYPESGQLHNDLTKAFLPLYAQLLQKEEENQNKSMAEVLLSYTDYRSDILSTWNGALRYEEKEYKNRYGKTWYYLKNTKTDTVYTNNEELADYLSETPPLSKDMWYLTFSYDENGALNRYFTSSNTAEEQTLFTMIDQFASSVNDQITTDTDDYGNKLWGEKHEPAPSIRAPREVEAVFVIQKGQITAPYDAYDAENELSYSIYYEQYFDVYYRVMMAALMIGVFFFRSALKDCLLLRWMRLHISFELHVFGTFFFLYVSWCFRFFPIEFSPSLSGLFPFINHGLLPFLFTCLLFLLTFLFVSSFVCMLVSIFGKEHGATIFDSLVHDTLIGKWRRYKDIVTFSSIFQTKTRAVLTFILIVLVFIFLIYFFDAMLYSMEFLLLALIFYAFFLYRLFANAYKNEQKQYERLDTFSKLLANGEYGKLKDIELGKYEPVKENLLHVSEHIEDAVQAELQSRNMKNELITNVSHDLKTPLTSIISYIDLLKKEGISEEEKTHYLDILTVSSNRLKHLIEDLFEISKANSGAVSLQPMDMDLISLIRQVELECDNLMKKRNLTIRNTFSDEKIMLKLDPQKTFRILENLIGNAGKYAMPNSRVFVEVSDYDSFVHLCIRNVSQQEIRYAPEQLLERFVRGDASRNSEGSGLGLAIAKSFTELQGGQMSLQIDGDLFKIILRFPRTEETKASAKESDEQKTSSSFAEAAENEGDA